MSVATLQVGRHTVWVDEEDLPLVEAWHWNVYQVKHVLYARGYPKGNPKGRRKYMHRLVAGDPHGLDVDHCNGNGLDNRRVNLRACSRSLNNANRKRVQSQTSRHKGVHFDKATGRWRAEVTYDGHRYRLGRFSTPEEAAEAYYLKAKEIFGDFASAACRP